MNTLPRVLLISTTGNVGGMERFQLNLAAELVRRGFEVGILFPETDDSPFLNSWCQRAHLDVQFVDPGLDTNQPRTRRLMRKLRTLVKENGPCIVHINYPSSCISVKDILAIRGLGCPIVVSTHGLASWATTSPLKAISTFLGAHLCKVVTVNSTATQKSMQQVGIASGKTRVIACGVPIPTQMLDRAVARRRLGIPDDEFVIASAGRLVEQKKMDDVIRAVAALPLQTRPVRMVVAGEGPERQNWERLTAELKAPVMFLGQQVEMTPVYAAANVFALPSEEESFGLVFVEAALQGVASIGVNQGGVPDIIEEGKTGFLVPLGNQAALTNALSLLQSNPQLCVTMGQAARLRCQKLFGAETMTDRFIELYQEVAGPRQAKHFKMPFPGSL